jgi:uncharacterized membrane protein YidH (DUF202 family)
VIATCFALISFAAAIVVGVGAGNSAMTILFRATCVLIVCWFIGLAVGAVAQWAILDHIKRYKQDHPIPEDNPVQGSVPQDSVPDT